jgi:hypothetical protein
MQHSDKTSKTVTRDINALKEMGLIRFVREKRKFGYRANKDEILAFLPIRCDPRFDGEDAN